jgi:hypothetical protein
MVVNIAYNWVPLNNKYIDDPDNFSLEDFELRWYLTEKKEQEKYFFGASIVGAFHLAKVLKACHEMLVIIEKNP